MVPILEILFMPGAFVGLWLLRITCELGINLQGMCALDHGSATSTGEHIFVRIGNIIFYGIVSTIFAVIYGQKRVKINFIFS